MFMSLPCLGNSFWSMSTFKGGTSAGENPPWPIDQWGNGWFHDGTGDPKTAQSRLAPTSMSQEQRGRFGILSIYRYTYWLLNRGNPLLINILNQSVGTMPSMPQNCHWERKKWWEAPGIQLYPHSIRCTRGRGCVSFPDSLFQEKPQ